MLGGGVGFSIRGKGNIAEWMVLYNNGNEKFARLFPDESRKIDLRSLFVSCKSFLHSVVSILLIKFLPDSHKLLNEEKLTRVISNMDMHFFTTRQR